MDFHKNVLAFVFCSVFLVFLVSGFSRNHPILSFDEGYSHLFGDGNLMLLKDGKSVHISLDDRTGSGFVSQEVYLHGHFSASIKLPADYTAGVVVAFYMSNADMYEKNHDEIDFEFLGNIRGKDWRIQTNIYGNGSTSIGREERYGLWFDPSEDFHQYSILWTENVIVFHIDNVPIREVKRTPEAMGSGFPSKPMSLYATIWDASDWATNGGKYRVNYKYAPFVAQFSDFVLHGCAVDPTDHARRVRLGSFRHDTSAEGGDAGLPGEAHAVLVLLRPRPIRNSPARVCGGPHGGRPAPTIRSRHTCRGTQTPPPPPRWAAAAAPPP